MMVNVPVATAQPVPVATAQPVVMAAPQMAGEEPLMMGTALPASEAEAPQPQQMSAETIGRILEANLDGWYGLESCPTCLCMRIVFTRDKSAFHYGPVCCCCCCCNPYYAPYAYKANPPGSTTFTNGKDPYTFIWQTPTSFFSKEHDNTFVKWC